MQQVLFTYQGVPHKDSKWENKLKATVRWNCRPNIMYLLPVLRKIIFVIHFDKSVKTGNDSFYNIVRKLS